MERKIIYLDDAIDALRYAQHRFTVADEAGGMGTVKWSEDVIYFATAERVLAELPSAQPERMTENREKCGMTNFEWMTHDERFVAFWLSEIGCDTCPAFTYCKKRSETVDESCVETLCNWLKCDFEREKSGTEIYKI